MSFTVDYSTDVGKVRALIGDVDSALQFLQDEEIAVFFELEAESHYGAASLALNAMATKQALILKKIETMDLKTDGPAVAKALRDLSKDMKQRAEDEPYFEVAEIIPYPLQWTATVWGLPSEAVGWVED
jgi:hypothetical protein